MGIAGTAVVCDAGVHLAHNGLQAPRDRCHRRRYTRRTHRLVRIQAVLPGKSPFSPAAPALGLSRQPISAPQSYKPYSPRIRRPAAHGDLPLHVKDSRQDTTPPTGRYSTEPLAGANGGYVPNGGTVTTGHNISSTGGAYAYTHGQNQFGSQPPHLATGPTGGYAPTGAYANGQSAYPAGRHSEDVETVPRPQE